MTKEIKKEKKILKDYQVNKKLLSQAKSDTILYCLPVGEEKR